MVEGVLHNKQSNEPDFYIKTKTSQTSIYMDRATKLDIILSTLRKTRPNEESSEYDHNGNESNQNQLEGQSSMD